MDKNKAISAKIATLINEGRSRDQAIAIAYSMWERGELKQQGGFAGAGYNLNNPFQQQTFQPINYNPAIPSSLLEQQPKTVSEQFGINNPLPYNVGNPTVPNSIGYSPDAVKYATENLSKTNPSNEPQYNDWVKYNILNPYAAGMDLNTRIAYTGQQFGKGNTAGGLMGAGLSLLGGARSFLSGYGSGKGEQRVQDQLNYNLYNRDEDLYRFAQEGTSIGDEQYYGEDLINKYPTTTSGIIQEPEIENFDANSARDTWEKKTGLPWSEAKRLGYTDGTAKDNIKLLSELKDPRFKKENLRTVPFESATQRKQVIQQGKQIQKDVAKDYFSSEEFKSLPKKNQQQQQKAAQSYFNSAEFKSLPRKKQQPMLSADSKSSYDREKEAKRKTAEYDDSLGFERALIYMADPSKAYYDLQSVINPMFTDESKTSEADRKAIMANRYNPNITRGERAVENIKMAAGYVPRAAANTAAVLSATPYTTFEAFTTGLPAASVPRAGYIGQGAQRVGQAAQNLLRQEGGLTVGQEYELSEEEIQNLIAQGYKIRYV